jgi:eukaryotic translation initiation factor 2C
MENLEEINKLTGGLRHLRLRDADELAKYAVPSDNVPRPGFNQTGKEIEVLTNSFPIEKFPSRPVYQYDVSIPSLHSRISLTQLDVQVQIGSGVEKFIVNKKVWASKARKNVLQQIIFDGSKLAW